MPLNGRVESERNLQPRERKFFPCFAKQRTGNISQVID